MRAPWPTLLAACIVLAEPTFAATPGTAFHPDLASLYAVPRHELPADAVQRALATESPRRDRFAVGVPLALTPDHGHWETLDAQTTRWRLRLNSPGAVSLSAHLAPLQLPEGAQLRIYDPRGKTVYGPYTQANVMPLGLWTPIIPGDELILEVLGPAPMAKDLRLGVAEGFHGYQDLAKANPGGPGTSGSCNIDVACSSASSWAREVRSVAMITVSCQNGTALCACSGQLVNNVSQDRTPLFLTARHCGINHDGPPDSVNFYFDYQNSTCGQTPALPRPASTVTGSTFLADDVVSDFSLVKMNVQPANLPADAYFAGWDATGGDPTSSGAAIHHPSADDKKISFYDSIARSAVDIGAACVIDAWQVHWHAGTTEQGSSGGGLWDGNSHALIGVLSGGNAACNTPSAPNAQDAPDYFGRLEQGWTASSSPAGQLKYWLDPADDGSCIAAIPGLDPATTPNPGRITSGPHRCQGPTSTCTAVGAGGGGGSPGTLVLGMLGALALRACRRRIRNPASP